ncbi:MAG: hypothetical protein COA57_11190 [Flavobacteriales bacterium]|nr:MAG: hypothetical protein COA57_11190 [Flavobacteriales bacterium]
MKNHKSIALYCSLLFLHCSLAFAQQSEIDSLEAILKEEIHDTVKVNTLNALAGMYTYAHPDTAIHYYQQAVKLSAAYVNNGDDKTAKIYNTKIADCLFSMGILYANRGNYKEAIEQFMRSMDIAKRIENETAIAKCHNGLGIIYSRQGLYDKAIENYLKSLRMYEEMAAKDAENHSAKEGIAKGMNNLGVVYLAQEDYDKALQYYLSALEKFRELKKDHGVAAILNNLGNTYYSEKNYEKAIDFYSQSIKAWEKLENQHGIAQGMMNMGNIYDDLGETEKAIDYYTRSLEINKEIGRKSGIARNFNNIGIAYFKSGKTDRAIEYGGKGFAVANEIGLKLEVKKSYNLLYQAFARQNDFKAAHKYLKLFTQLKDTLFNEEKSKEIGKLEAKYEFEKTEAERKRIQQEELRLENEKMKRRNLLQYSGIFIFILVLGTGILFLGRLNLSVSMTEGLVFFTFLLFFEFLLVLTDPYVDKWTGGMPLYKLIINAGLAAVIFPLHAFFESLLKRKLLKRKN